MNNFTRNVIGLAVSIASILGVLWGIGYTITRYVDDNFGDGTSGIFFIFISAVVLTMSVVAITMFLTNRTHQSAGDDVVGTVGGLRQAFGAEARTHGQIRVIDARAQLEDHRTRNFEDRQQLRLVSNVNARRQRQAWAEEDARTRQQETSAAEFDYWSTVDDGDGVTVYSED